MGLYKRLETELTVLLQYNYSRRKMEAHVFKSLLKQREFPKDNRDMGDLEEQSQKIVSDYLRRHWWQYLISRIEAHIRGIY